MLIGGETLERDQIAREKEIERRKKGRETWVGISKSEGKQRGQIIIVKKNSFPTYKSQFSGGRDLMLKFNC